MTIALPARWLALVSVPALIACGQSALGEDPQFPAHPETIPGTSVAFEMVSIPAGLITDPGAQPVRVAPFRIGRTEVTWEMYDVFLYALDVPHGEADPLADAVTRPSKPYMPPDRGYGHAGYPAISMTYEGARAFCRWLSLKTGRTYRLPMEDEWRLAAGAPPAQSEKGADTLDRIAWSAHNAGLTTHPVGRKAPSARGLFDMYGNVAEWCVGRDGEPIVKGGSFRDDPDRLGPMTRVRQSPDWNISDPQIPKSRWWLADCDFVGFRLVEQPDPPSQDTSSPQEHSDDK